MQYLCERKEDYEQTKKPSQNDNPSAYDSDHTLCMLVSSAHSGNPVGCDCSLQSSDLGRYAAIEPGMVC